MKDDKSLLVQVQQALANEERLRNNLDNIYVLINNGAVIIAGSVDNYLSKKLTKTLISSIPGVVNVIDDLKIEFPFRIRISVQIDWAKGNMMVSQ